MKMLDRQTGRNSVISISRIIGMFFIVICHIIKYYTFIPGSSFLGHFFSCGVYLFIFISGYLYGTKIVNSFGKWYCKRILTVSFPAIIVSIIVIIALAFNGVSVSVETIIAYGLDLEGLLFLNWQFFSSIFDEIASLGPLWFTTIIMLCYLLVPLLQRVVNRFRITIIFMIVITIFGVALSFFPYISFIYFIIFAIGFFCGRRSLLNSINKGTFIIATFVFVLGNVGRVVLQRAIDGTTLYQTFAGWQSVISGIYLVVLCSFLYNSFPNIVGKVANLKLVKIFDSYSFYVYLVHGVFCMGVFNFYELFPLGLATILFFSATVFTAFFIRLLCDIITKPILAKLKV